MGIVKLSENADGSWSVDPAGDIFDITHEAGGLVFLRHAERGIVLALPHQGLPSVETHRPEKEESSGMEGQDGQ